MRYLGAAGRAIRRPEIEYHCLSFEVAELLHLVVGRSFTETGPLETDTGGAGRQPANAAAKTKIDMLTERTTLFLHKRPFTGIPGLIAF